jgi:ribosomal protein L7/L12
LDSNSNKSKIRNPKSKIAMSVPFQCPSCMRHLEFSGGDSAFQNCPYCKGKIIVPSTTVHLEEMEEQPPTDFALREQRDFKLAEIRSELDAGRKIEAIKLFRETFGTGLKEAKDAVETLERGGSVNVSKAAMRENYSALQENPADQKIYQNMTNPPTVSTNSGWIVAIFVLIAVGIAFFIIFSGN